MQEISHELALHNPSDVDILEYPISEYVLDKNGNPRIDTDTQQPITTGDTYTWTLNSGETKIFPKYVADYLMKIYGFLEIRDMPKEEVTMENPVEMRKSQKNEDGTYRCRYCGQEAKNARGLGLHIAAKHPEALVE